MYTPSTSTFGLYNLFNGDSVRKEEALESTVDDGHGGNGGLGGKGAPETPLSKEAILESHLPDEVTDLVVKLRNHIDTHKKKFLSVYKDSTFQGNMEVVSQAIEEVRSQVNETSHEIHQQVVKCDSLKTMVETDDHNAELLYELEDLQFNQPGYKERLHKYLATVVQSFQQKMAIYNAEIEKAQGALRALETESQPAFALEDLFWALKLSKSSLFLVTAKLKSLHEDVRDQLEVVRTLIGDVNGDLRLSANNVHTISFRNN